LQAPSVRQPFCDVVKINLDFTAFTRDTMSIKVAMNRAL
jgi:hypothetical protein